MEVITLITIIIGFLGLVLMNLQLNNQIRQEVRVQFKELKEDIKDLRDEMKAIHTRIDVMSSRVDATNSRIDRLSDAIYSQKTS